MIYFLERIAEKLKDEYSDRLNKHCLVFPNRRAGLYFLKYLAAMIGKPVWAPSTTTINELFRSYSTLQIAGNEILLFELFKVYRKIKKEPESFDDFFTWGDMLLDDFDDVVNSLVGFKESFVYLPDSFLHPLGAFYHIHEQDLRFAKRRENVNVLYDIRTADIIIALGFLDQPF